MLWPEPERERVIKLKNSFKLNLVSIIINRGRRFYVLIYGDIRYFYKEEI